MNRIKIIALVLAVIAVLPLFAACGVETKTASNVTVIFRVPKMTTDEEGNTIPELDENGYQVYEDKLAHKIDSISGTVELRDPTTGKTIKAPTVLSAVEVAFKKFQKEFELSKDGGSIIGALGYKEATRYEDGVGYYDYWRCTINDQESSDGRQSITRIYTDDVIVFTWTSGQQDIQGTPEESVTDEGDDETGKVDIGETEAPEEPDPEE
ncbi:MAG: hypothetical protein IKL24_03200 [Clostridia bacterium]|nr:hypothetical protein [Clostridia bacterium]